jgi:2-polyprenyl-6-methoxyphenol hydroxylase-like FAD-dependent oxidoreductase
MNTLVLVVGAGPVGLTMAMALRHRGVDVRIIDKCPAPTDKSKALVLWPRTLELLDIHACSQVFVDAGLKATGAHIMADGQTLAKIALDAVHSDFRYVVMIPQNETERLLGEQLGKVDVHVERSVELTSFTEDGDGVSAVLQHADGRAETVRASYLIACDGAHSTVRHGLGATFEGDTLPSNWVLADLELDGDCPGHEITIAFTPDGVMAIFPIGGKRFRIIADVELLPEGSPQDPSLEDIQALLDHRGPSGLRAHDPIWISRFRINERKVKDYRHGRVFLAGDAAHVHSPAGGQGMNTGMQDAFNLAWKLAMVWHGQAVPSLLDTYSPERSAIGDQVLRNAGNLTKLALIRNPILREIRRLAAGALGHIAAMRQRMADQLSEVDLHYPDSALTQSPRGAAHHPAGGDRARDVALSHGEHGATRLHEILATGKFAVLSVGAPRMDLPESLRSIATVAEANTVPDYESGHVYLIRPDAYVAMSTSGTDTAAITAALQRLLPGSD